jgi:Carboxypeptidase regulatory-like domain/TonB-dependent Receptor Plug Domain
LDTKVTPEFTIRSNPAVWLTALLCLPTGASAQALLGLVREDSSRAPIVGAEVTLFDMDDQQAATTVTDSAGRFHMGVPSSGRYTIHVSHLAYTKFVSDLVDIGLSETVEIEIRLGRAVIPIEPLVVTARSRESGRLSEFHQRLRQRNFGHFVTRMDLERRAHARVSDIIRTIPGVTMQSVRARRQSGPERYIVAMRGSSGLCEPAIYIDGVRVNQQADGTVDEMLTPDMLEGVEVYTSTVGAPSQYVQTGTCGVVLFWTRQGDTGPKFSWKRLLAGVAAVAVVILILR